MVFFFFRPYRSKDTKTPDQDHKAGEAMNDNKTQKEYRNEELTQRLPVGTGLFSGAQVVAMSHAVSEPAARIKGRRGLKTRVVRALRTAARPVLRTLVFRHSEDWKRVPASRRRGKIVVGNRDDHRRRAQWLTYKSIASAVTRSG